MLEQIKSLLNRHGYTEQEADAYSNGYFYRAVAANRDVEEDERDQLQITISEDTFEFVLGHYHFDGTYVVIKAGTLGQVLAAATKHICSHELAVWNHTC